MSIATDVAPDGTPILTGNSTGSAGVGPEFADFRLGGEQVKFNDVSAIVCSFIGRTPLATEQPALLSARGRQVSKKREVAVQPSLHATHLRVCVRIVH